MRRNDGPVRTEWPLCADYAVCDPPQHHLPIEHPLLAESQYHPLSVRIYRLRHSAVRLIE